MNSLDAAKNKYRSRRKRAAKEKVGIVMREWKAGNLKSGSGAKVTDRRQAVAIALSEARKHPFKR